MMSSLNETLARVEINLRRRMLWLEQLLSMDAVQYRISGKRLVSLVDELEEGRLKLLVGSGLL
jgi:hypothetical protein